MPPHIMYAFASLFLAPLMQLNVTTEGDPMKVWGEYQKLHGISWH